jgi:glycosyltransferase involved in cell wall biosynthesis
MKNNFYSDVSIKYQLTIIIPHFNDSDALVELLVTIPKNPKIQIIVVDDNSTKSKLEFEKLKNQYRHVEFYTNDSNKKGAGACRNIGMKKASGKWVLFADSDDFFMKDFFITIQKYLTSSYDIVYFKPTSILKTTNNTSCRHIGYEMLIVNFLQRKDDISELKLRYEYIVPWSKLFLRKFLLDNYIWFDDVIAANDVMFSTKAGHYAKNIFASDDYIYCVTDRSGSLTKNKSEEVYFARLYTHIRRSDFLRSHLSKREYKILRIGGRGFLKVAVQNRLGIRVFIKTLFLLIKNQIPLVYLEDFNFMRNRKNRKESNNKLAIVCKEN